MKHIHGARISASVTQPRAQHTNSYSQVLVDIGTGDGRFVEYIARTQPNWRVIGVDACRENLRVAARRLPQNAEFIIANALALPQELHGSATWLTINFPWGSLLHGLLDRERGLVEQLIAITQPNALLEIRLNGGALAEAGWDFEAGSEQVRGVLMHHGFNTQSALALDKVALRAIPTTWAKRLAWGRDPRACLIRAARR